MGHDFISVEEDHELFNDLDLWTLRHFLVEQARAMEISEPNNNTKDVRKFFESWEWHGPGVFTGTDFATAILRDRSRWRLLLQLLQSAGDRIAAFGDTIPLQYLAAHLSTHDAVFTKPLPTHPLLAGIGRICTLLGRHEPKEQPNQAL